MLSFNISSCLRLALSPGRSFWKVLFFFPQIPPPHPGDWRKLTVTATKMAAQLVSWSPSPGSEGHAFLPCTRPGCSRAWLLCTDHSHFQLQGFRLGLGCPPLLSLAGWNPVTPASSPKIDENNPPLRLSNASF